MGLSPNLTLPVTLRSWNLNFSLRPLAQHPPGRGDGNFILRQEDLQTRPWYEATPPNGFYVCPKGTLLTGRWSVNGKTSPSPNPHQLHTCPKFKNWRKK